MIKINLTKLLKTMNLIIFVMQNLFTSDDFLKSTIEKAIKMSLI